MKEIEHPDLIEEWKFKKDTASYKKVHNKRKLLSNNEEIDRHNIKYFLPTIIIEDMQWFLFQGIMLHAENNIKSPADHLKSLLKVLSMFKISIRYDESIAIYFCQRMLEQSS